MGYMLGNMSSARLANGNTTWSSGEYDALAVREFTLPEPDRREYAETLAEFEASGTRVLVVSREWTEDGKEDSLTEVIPAATPVLVANLLAWYGITRSDDGGEHYYTDGPDEHFTAGHGRPVHVVAEYSARLIGFSPLALAVIARAVGVDVPAGQWRDGSTR